MAYDDRARATAARMLAPKASGGKGQTVTLALAGGGTYNPATGGYSGATTTTQTGSGVEMAYSAREIDGETVQRGDVKFMLSPLTTAGAEITTAKVGATLTNAAGVEWRIMAAEPFAPAGLVTHYDLQLRRS